MRAVIQRVSRARITINKKTTKEIGSGLLILLGIENEDHSEDVNWLAGKISRLRIFPDQDGTMNLSILDIEGEAMVVSQFTLHASTKKGNRPSWIKAAAPGFAEPLYREFVTRLEQESGRQITTGEFGAHMDIELVNDGPVTLLIDTKNKE